MSIDQYSENYMETLMNLPEIKQSGFTMGFNVIDKVPRRILSLHDKKILEVLFDYFHRSEKNKWVGCFPKQITIAKRLGISRSKVNECLRKCHYYGFMGSYRTDRASKYFLIPEKFKSFFDEANSLKTSKEIDAFLDALHVENEKNRCRLSGDHDVQKNDSTTIYTQNLNKKNNLNYRNTEDQQVEFQFEENSEATLKGVNPLRPPERQGYGKLILLKNYMNKNSSAEKMGVDENLANVLKPPTLNDQVGDGHVDTEIVKEIKGDAAAEEIGGNGRMMFSKEKQSGRKPKEKVTRGSGLSKKSSKQLDALVDCFNTHAEPLGYELQKTFTNSKMLELVREHGLQIALDVVEYGVKNWHRFHEFMPNFTVKDSPNLFEMSNPIVFERLANRAHQKDTQKTSVDKVVGNSQRNANNYKQPNKKVETNKNSDEVLKKDPFLVDME